MTHTPPKKSAYELIRGGRLRRTTRGIVSLAPFLASVSAASLGMMSSMVAPTNAGTCTGSAGTYICSGIASTSDSQQTLSAGSGEALVVTSYKDFGIQLSGYHDAFYLRGTRSSTSMNVVLAGDGIIRTDMYRGFFISHYGTGNAYIKVDQQITSGGSGIYAETSSGSGSLTLKTRNIDATADVDYIYADGIEVVHRSSGDLAIETHNIEANERGIDAEHRGSGSVTITAGGNIQSGIAKTEAQEADGIIVEASTGVTTTTVTAMGDINTNNRGAGVRILHNGSGGVTVTTHGAVTGSDGIHVGTGAGTSDAVVVAANGNIASERSGINIAQNGSGAVTVTTNAGNELTSESGYGIRIATATTTTGGVAVMSGAAIAATESTGVYVIHNGSGVAKITANGIKAGRRGIEARINSPSNPRGSGGSIYANGAITAEYEGILAWNHGADTLAITVADGATVTSNTREGIEATGSRLSTGAIKVEAYANITAHDQAILVDQYGTGNVTVTTHDGVELRSTVGEGIMVKNQTAKVGAVTITVGSSGNISAEKEAISVSLDAASVGIATRAGTQLTSTSGHGIRIETKTEASGDVEVSIGGNIAAEKRGIYIEQAGVGAVAVTTNTGPN